MRFFALLFLIYALPGLAASTYTDSKLPVRFTLPDGWKVRPAIIEGKRALRVIAHDADQRERAAIEVIISLRTLKSKETMTQYAETQRGNNEPITPLAYEWRRGRLETDYRGGRYVSSGLWIMQRTKMVLLRVDKKQIIDARCSANLTEYKTYRKALESICKSVQIVPHK